MKLPAQDINVPEALMPFFDFVIQASSSLVTLVSITLYQCLLMDPV
jgi:hypothetical protein